MMTTEYFENYRNGVVNLYLNLCRYSAIKYDENMSLDSIKGMSKDLNRDNICFLTKNNIKIDYNEGLKAKDIFKYEQNGRRINLVDLEFYKRYQVIEHLNELDKMEHFDWLEQTEFFKKLKELAGDQIVQGIIDELFNERLEHRGKCNKDYIIRFLKLLKFDSKIESNSTDYDF